MYIGQMFSPHPYLKAVSLEQPLGEGEVMGNPHSKDRGGGEKPPITWIGLTSQLAITSSWWPRPAPTQHAHSSFIPGLVLQLRSRALVPPGQPSTLSVGDPQKSLSTSWRTPRCQCYRSVVHIFLSCSRDGALTEFLLSFITGWLMWKFRLSLNNNTG